MNHRVISMGFSLSRPPDASGAIYPAIMARNQRFIDFTSNFTEHGFYLKIFLDLLRAGYTIQKIDLDHCTADTKNIAIKRVIHRF